MDLRTQPSFVIGKATRLPFEIINGNEPRPYDITPEGKQFIVMLPPAQAESGERPTQQINVVLNWFEELKQRLPVK